jgi:hypothetical protein
MRNVLRTSVFPRKATGEAQRHNALVILAIGLALLTGFVANLRLYTGAEGAELIEIVSP